MNKFGKAWLELALEIVQAANEGMSLSSFNSFQKLALPQAGKGLRDRQRVLKTVLDAKLVEIVDGRLVLAAPNIPNWLAASLKDGEASAWEIIQTIDQTGSLEKKFDDSNLKEIGEIGERALLEILKTATPIELHSQIKKISDHDDSAGYDILAPMDRLGNQLKLEVKTTSRPPSADFTFFLSRNEGNIGQRLENWYLIAMQIMDEKTTVIGHVASNSLMEYFPKDSSERSSWQSVKITLSKEKLTKGLPKRDF